MRRLILRSHQSPGDILMLTAAVRDLHAAHPGQFQTDVRTSTDDLWLNNPHVTPLDEGTPDVESIDMHYPLIHKCNTRPYHFIHGYAQFLEERLGVRIPVLRFSGDVHLTDAEKQQPALGAESEIKDRFWIIVAGGKYDFTAKWWNPESYQKVVDHFQGRIQFVQCGEAGHWHPPLTGVVNLIGKTATREFVRLMHHADGVVCPVTFAMHLASAVETKPDRPKNRACVVIAGGREPPHWEAYPHHQFLSTNGALDCCSDGGCWKSRCQKVGDGDSKDRSNLCEQPVELTSDLCIPKCMDMISPEDVIRRIELYYQGGALQFSNGHSKNGHPAQRNGSRDMSAVVERPQHRQIVKPLSAVTSGDHSVSFYHGLGDAAYFAHLIPLYVKRGYEIAVECTPDKRVLFEAAGAKVIEKGQARAVHDWGYPSNATPRAAQGNFHVGSKMGHNISQAPLPDIGGKAELWQEFVTTRVDVAPHISDEDRQKAQDWLSRLPRPIVLFHQKGNTAQERKSLPDSIAAKFYEQFIERCNGTLILMDWDRRVPRLASHRIRHLDDLGKCPTSVMLAIMLEADLLIGVDSGPLHAARLTGIPIIGVWMPGHYPSTYTLPRPNQLNVVLAEHTKQWNRFKRIPWNIVAQPGSQFDPSYLATLTAQMLAKPVYIPEDRGADVQMRQFVREFCQCRGTSSLAEFWDRDRSFNALLRAMTARFEKPTVVETGTIRAEEDWGGAGFFTYLMGAYLHRRGGKLHSADITPEHCDFARTWTAVFGDSVTIHQQDSVAFIQEFNKPIDVLYVDSLDTTEPNHAAHALREVQVAEPNLHERSIVIFDDTPWSAGAFIGKGATAIPYLQQKGWQILYAGYQVVMSREASTTTGGTP
jgi:ADP-heptose:LPS heptosyltransferase